jgi:hypothetical protein
MAGVEDMQKKYYEMEDRLSQMMHYLEEKIRGVTVGAHGINQGENIGSGGSDTFKISSQETFRS